MNKLLPIVGVVVVILALVFGGLWFVNKDKKAETGLEEEEEDEVVQELTLEDKPYLTITPGASCEYTIALSNIKKDPSKIEYELIYKNEEGVTQGASGTLTPSSSETTKKVLFGTESSGTRRCDKGVEGGDVTIRYRNDEGKLMAKLIGKFAVVEGGTTLALGDKFSLELSKSSKDKFVVVDTFGLPESVEGNVAAGPVGVFTSGKSTALAGTLTFEGTGNLQVFDGSKWSTIEDGKVTKLGTFVKTN